MPDAKTITAAVSLVVAGAAVGFAARTPSAPAAAVSVPLGSGQAPSPTNHCKDACASIASWCPAGSAANCVDLLTRFDRESRDGGAHFSCDEPLTQTVLDSLGWCPNGGKSVPILVKP